ncbi:cytochrome C [Halorhodospira abdelmalekii]|uniref:FCSD flavin-binding domain-containing protein n=1 Tax=Halorhodospira abdelmalekii TaxID=421629 RepID=UPI0019030356|nr:cytochrome C [Halorhodospira abdelmalekii]
MDRLTRRQFIGLVGASGVSAAAALSGCAPTSPRPSPESSGARVVVVGGGPGGATAAKYLKYFEPNLDVTLVEPKRSYYTCFGGNWYLGGFRELETLRHDYRTLTSRYGVRVVHDRAIDLDADGRRLITEENGSLPYEKLVLAPGIELDYSRVEGMGASDAEAIPHAWEGGKQYAVLRSQLLEMKDGGTFIMCAPPNPFRCPPGPYERASLVAHYLKEHKPRSKVLILDDKDGFSKQGLFKEGWEALYGDMIEWVPASAGGALDHVSVAECKVYTDGGAQAHRADVLNVIPPQRAGRVAQQMGLTDDDGWCSINQLTFASDKHPDVHVLGDAAVVGAMPKSGHAANNQAKVVAVAILAELRGHELPEPTKVNTCYSLLAPDWGVTVAAVYKYEEGEIRSVEGAGGLSPEGASRDFRLREADFAPAWYAAITQDIFR